MFFRLIFRDKTHFDASIKNSLVKFEMMCFYAYQQNLYRINHIEIKVRTLRLSDIKYGHSTLIAYK